MITLFNETTLNVNRKNMRFEGVYTDLKGKQALYKTTLAEVLKAEVFTKQEMINKHFDEITDSEYLVITLNEMQEEEYKQIVWSNSRCSLRQAR